MVVAPTLAAAMLPRMQWPGISFKEDLEKEIAAAQTER